MEDMCSEDSNLAQDDDLVYSHGINSPELEYRVGNATHTHSHISEHGYASPTSSVDEYNGLLEDASVPMPMPMSISSEENGHDKGSCTHPNPHQLDGPNETDLNLNAFTADPNYNQPHLSTASTPAPNSVRVHQRTRSNSGQPWMENIHPDVSIQALSLPLPRLGVGTSVGIGAGPGAGRCFSDGYAWQSYCTSPRYADNMQPIWYDQSAITSMESEYSHGHGHGHGDVHRATPLPQSLPLQSPQMTSQMVLQNDYIAQSSVSPGPGLGQHYGWPSWMGSYYPPLYPPPPPPHIVPVAGPVPAAGPAPPPLPPPHRVIPDYALTPTPAPLSIHAHTSYNDPSMYSHLPPPPPPPPPVFRPLYPAPPLHRPSPMPIRHDSPGLVPEAAPFNTRSENETDRNNKKGRFRDAALSKLERDEEQEKKTLHKQTRGKQFHDAVMKRIEQFEEEKARRAEEREKRRVEKATRAARDAKEAREKAEKAEQEVKEKEAREREEKEARKKARKAEKADREARERAEKDAKRADQEARIADQEAKLTALREKEKAAKTEQEAKAKADREARKAEKDTQEKAANAQREAREKAKILAVQARSRALREEADQKVLEKQKEKQKQDEAREKAKTLAIQARSTALREEANQKEKEKQKQEQEQDEASQTEQFDAFVNNILEYSRLTDEIWTVPDSFSLGPETEIETDPLQEALKPSTPDDNVERPFSLKSKAKAKAKAYTKTTNLASLCKDSEPEYGLSRETSTVIGMERASKHNAVTKWTYAEPQKTISQRLEETNQWFYTDNRAEAGFRRTVTVLANRHETQVYENENVSLEETRARNRREKEMIVLVGDAIANLGAYVSERDENRTDYFSEFADVCSCAERLNLSLNLRPGSGNPSGNDNGGYGRGIDMDSIGSSRGSQYRRARMNADKRVLQFGPAGL